MNGSSRLRGADITYIRLKTGFVYLVAIVDWFSRYILAFDISITLEADFCVETLQRALVRATPEIFNSDQGSQFTSPRHTEILHLSGVRMSMDGRGRALDKKNIERFYVSRGFFFFFFLMTTKRSRKPKPESGAISITTTMNGSISPLITRPQQWSISRGSKNNSSCQRTGE